MIFLSSLEHLKEKKRTILTSPVFHKHALSTEAGVFTAVLLMFLLILRFQ